MQRVALVFAHAHGQGFQAPQHQPTVPRPRNRAGRVLVKLDFIVQIVPPRNHRASDHVAVSAQVFRRAVHHEVRAQLQRPLEIRARKRVVHRQQRSGTPRHFGHRRQIHELQQRIRRRLHPDQPRVRPDRRREGRRRSRIGVVHLHAPRAIHFLQQPVRPAVQVVARHHVVARRKQLEHGRRGRHAGSERQAVGAAFERRQRPFQRLARRIARARIFVGARPADAVLLVGRRLVHRHRHRPRQGFRGLPVVDGSRFKFHARSPRMPFCCLPAGPIAKSNRTA